MSGQIAHAFEDAAKKAEQGLAKDFANGYHDILKETEQKTGQVADHVAENEARTVDDLGKAAEHPGSEPSVAAPRPQGGASGGRNGSPDGLGNEEPDLAAGNPGGGQGTEGNGGCETGGTDPIDIVSGQMICDAVDLELPGLLALVLRRAYASGYVGGTIYGPGWSSTLSQRVQIDRQGIHYAGDDGQVLHYPVPTQPGQPVYPTDGARWPLLWDRIDDTIRIDDPRSGIGRSFPAPAGGGSTRPIASLFDRNGHRVDFRYAIDNAAMPVMVEHSGGYRVAVDSVYASVGWRIEALRVLDGSDGGLGTAVRRYGYDPRGRLSEVWGSSGTPLAFAYDALDRITSWTDTNGHAYHYHYDDSGRVTKAEGDQGLLSVSLVYDLDDRATAMTDAAGHTSVYRYDEHCHIIEATDPLGHVTGTEYDRYGYLLAHTDPLGHTTRFERDPHGELRRLVRPDGCAFTIDRDDEGLPVRVVDPCGEVWQYTWDPRGNPIVVTDPTGATTQYRYDEEGRPWEQTDPLGRRTALRCDRAGLPVETTDPFGATTSCIRDAFGRPVAVTDPMGDTTRYTWTLEGRPSSHTAPDGTVESWTWDGEGNRLSHTDQLGLKSTVGYGPFDVPVSRVTPDGAEYTFGYDSLLNLTRVTNPVGDSWTYNYDEAGRLVGETDFDGRVMAYSLDRNGRLVVVTNPLGESVRYRYDVMGNPVVREAGGGLTQYLWDALGRLVGATGPEAALIRHLDPLGRVMDESVNGRVLSTRYDLLGRAVLRRTPSGLESVRTYGDADQPTALRTDGHVTTFERDSLGRETARRLAGGVVLTQSWDGIQRLVEQSLTTDSDSPPIQHRRYDYRADSGLIRTWDQQSGTRTFELDVRGRVTSVTAANWTENYCYDLAGRLTSAEWPTRRNDAVGQRGYRGTLLRTAGRLKYVHDAAGRVISRTQTTLSGGKRTWHYTWDAEDRLTQAVTPDGARWFYGYDPLGRRTEKRHLADDGTVTERTVFTWEGDALVEQTAEAPGLPGPHTMSWDYDGLQVITQSEAIAAGPDAAPESVERRFFTVISDPVGTPTHLVSPDGATGWRARSALWGETEWPTDSSTYMPLRFPGQYFDPETRLHYNRHRYYDPATSRYLSPDPLGLTASPDAHAYVDNPLTEADPLGLAPCVTIRHYTTKEGYQKIMGGGDKDSILLKASSPSKGNPRGVYVSPMSPADVTKKPGGFKSFLGLTREKSEYMIEFQAPADNFSGRLRGGRSHVWFSPGDVKIPRKSITYHGPTSGWTG